MLTTTPSLHHRRPRQAGVTLIELMVSLTVGLLVVGAMTAIFLQSSRARNANERINRQVENARYAMQLITTDLHICVLDVRLFLILRLLMNHS